MCFFFLWKLKCKFKKIKVLKITYGYGVIKYWSFVVSWCIFLMLLVQWEQGQQSQTDSRVLSQLIHFPDGYEWFIMALHPLVYGSDSCIVKPTVNQALKTCIMYKIISKDNEKFLNRTTCQEGYTICHKAWQIGQLKDTWPDKQTGYIVSEGTFCTI